MPLNNFDPQEEEDWEPELCYSNVWSHHFRLDRLRHHLMTLYYFDPQEADWEVQLLDDCTMYMFIVMWCVSAFQTGQTTASSRASL